MIDRLLLYSGLDLSSSLQLFKGERKRIQRICGRQKQQRTGKAERERKETMSIGNSQNIAEEFTSRSLNPGTSKRNRRTIFCLVTLRPFCMIHINTKIPLSSTIVCNLHLESQMVQPSSTAMDRIDSLAEVTPMHSLIVERDAVSISNT